MYFETFSLAFKTQIKANLKSQNRLVQRPQFRCHEFRIPYVLSTSKTHVNGCHIPVLLKISEVIIKVVSINGWAQIHD